MMEINVKSYEYVENMKYRKYENIENAKYRKYEIWKI